MMPLLKIIGYNKKNNSDDLSQKKAALIVKELLEAKKDWYNAKHLFNCVTDEDLIDYAAYMILATEKKYVYLLRKARQEHIRSINLEINS